MNKIKISIIVAIAENRCIGKDNKMPWHISDDLKRFKSFTEGHPVIMGRKTFESIVGYLGKPLPNRKNIIISRSEYSTDHNVAIYKDIDSALKHAKVTAQDQKLDEIFIIGGAQIYTQTIDQADRLHITKVHKSVNGDAFFPPFNDNQWQETARTDNLEHEPPYSFITLERR